MSKRKAGAYTTSMRPPRLSVNVRRDKSPPVSRIGPAGGAPLLAREKRVPVSSFRIRTDNARQFRRKCVGGNKASLIQSTISSMLLCKERGSYPSACAAAVRSKWPLESRTDTAYGVKKAVDVSIRSISRKEARLLWRDTSAGRGPCAFYRLPARQPPESLGRMRNAQRGYTLSRAIRTARRRQCPTLHRAHPQNRIRLGPPREVFLRGKRTAYV